MSIIIKFTFIASPFTLLTFNSYKWYIPFTYTIEKIGSQNNETALITPNNLWKKVEWILPNETNSIHFII